MHSRGARFIGRDVEESGLEIQSCPRVRASLGYCKVEFLMSNKELGMRAVSVEGGMESDGGGVVFYFIFLRDVIIW